MRRVIAVPFAFFMARGGTAQRLRSVLVAAVLVPLWASLPGQGLRLAHHAHPDGPSTDATFGTTPGLRPGRPVVLTLTYLWLPYMILPVYSGFERLPEAHLEASADLGRAGPRRPSGRVVLPR